jgi:hypothetical protein
MKATNQRIHPGSHRHLFPRDARQAHAKHAALVAAVVVTTILDSCAFGVSFKVDRRIEILRPKDLSRVVLPVTVEWRVRDFKIGEGAGAFAIFVDRAPQPAGKPIGWLFRDDPACGGAGSRSCEDPDFLAERRIYVTRSSSFTVEQVTQLTGTDAGRRFHEVTIVLLGARGNRAGEGAWPIRFQTPDQK